MKHIQFMLLTIGWLSILSFPPQASGVEGTPDAERAFWSEAGRSVAGKGRDAFPDVARLMDRTDLGSKYLEWAFVWIGRLDGWDIFAQGDSHLLASTRRILPRLLDHDKRYEYDAVRSGLIYLAKKGDARDFPFFEKYMEDPMLQPSSFVKDQGKEEDHFLWLSVPYRVLRHRVAGTNIVEGIFERRWYPYYDSFDLPMYSYTTNDLRFIPSVANTGPQAAYVYAAFEQAHALGRRLGCDTPYSSITNIAPELLTMRVWLDADGNAVCDVDLAKRGISVPGLRMADPSTPAPPLKPWEQPPPAIPAGTNAPTAAAPLPADGMPESATVPAGLATSAAAAKPATTPSQPPWITVLSAFGAGIAVTLGLSVALRKKRLK